MDFLSQSRSIASCPIVDSNSARSAFSSFSFARMSFSCLLSLNTRAAFSKNSRFQLRSWFGLIPCSAAISPSCFSSRGTSKELCSWAGLTPQNQESAGKKKTTRIGRAGQYLKPLLVQIALAVSKSSKHPEIKNKYDSLKKRRGGKKRLSRLHEDC